MPTSAAGNKATAPPRLALRRSARPRHATGFTLIELMVVVALMAVATAGVSLSLRDSAADALERDAQRLAAVLESARAQSRASGAVVRWQAQNGGYVLQGLPRPSALQNWLSDQTRVEPGPPVVLGPEPLIPAQQIMLWSALPNGPRLWVATDGLRPFEVRREPVQGLP